MKSLATLGNELYSGRTSIPFIARRRIWYTIAVVVIAVSAVLVVKPGLNPGIDFKGGIEVTFPRPDSLRSFTRALPTRTLPCSAARWI